jgi:hypothetical protein
MSLSALESVEDAFDATKRLLWPFARGTWFRLAAVMLFVGAVGGFSPTSAFSFTPFPGDSSQPPGDGGPQPDPGTGVDPGSLTPEVTPTLVVFLVGLALFLVAAFLLWGVASAVMEFVFVESLGSEAVRLREYFRENVRPGVRLFAFRTVVSLLILGGLAAAILLVGVLLGGWPVTQWGDSTAFAVILLAIPLGLVAFVTLGLVQGITTTFVVPAMLAEDRGVVSGWRRILGTVADNWQEYLVYLVVNWVLGLAIGFVTSILTLAVLIVVGIPALLITVPTVLAIGVTPIAGTILLVVWLLAGVLFFVALLVIAVPFRTFQRYYALLVLGDIDTDLDVVPTTRAAVRADGGTSGEDADGDGPGDDDSGSDGTVAGDDGDGPGDGDDETGDSPGGAGGDDGWNVDR